jgi:muramoyltetrapeptide carboxypeptidase
VIFPPAIVPGDRIAVVAPSSPMPRLDLWRGLAWLRDRYAIQMHEVALERTGYLAGSDDRRAADLSSAMLDHAIRAIFIARGGYGLTRIVERLPWSDFARSPKWIIGFSDVTAIHVACASRGIASVHGPNVTGLGRARPLDRFRALEAVEDEGKGLVWKLEPIVPGGCSGMLFGGNLALLAAMAASNSLAVPEGSIVVLEDVTERPYRIDRMLTSLASHLGHAGAIVFGDFTECDAGPDGVCVDDVFIDFARRLGKPAFRGAPVGHGIRNESFVVGGNARIESNVLSGD